MWRKCGEGLIVRRFYVGTIVGGRPATGERGASPFCAPGPAWCRLRRCKSKSWLEPLTFGGAGAALRRARSNLAASFAVPSRARLLARGEEPSRHRSDRRSASVIHARVSSAAVRRKYDGPFGRLLIWLGYHHGEDARIGSIRGGRFYRTELCPCEHLFPTLIHRGEGLIERPTSARETLPSGTGRDGADEPKPGF
jgi:hypothetical protein